MMMVLMLIVIMIVLVVVVVMVVVVLMMVLMLIVIMIVLVVVVVVMMVRIMIMMIISFVPATHQGAARLPGQEVAPSRARGHVAAEQGPQGQRGRHHPVRHLRGEPRITCARASRRPNSRAPGVELPHLSPHAIFNATFDAISRTKRALPYPARGFRRVTLRQNPAKSA